MQLRILFALFALYSITLSSAQAQVPCEALRYFNPSGQELVYTSSLPTPWWAIKNTVEWEATVDTAYVAFGIDRHANSGVTPDTLEIRILDDVLPSIFVKDHLTLMVPPNLHGLVPDGYYIVEFAFDPPVATFPGQRNFWLSWRLRGPQGDKARIRLKYPAVNARRSVVIGSAGDTTIATTFVKTALSLGRQDSVDLWGEVRVCYPNGVPVELMSFTAAYRGGEAHLAWETATEENNYGFDVERLAVSSEAEGVRVWQRIGFIPGHGSSKQAHAYRFVDTAPVDAVLEGGIVRYRLRQIDFDGTTELSHIAQIHVPLETGFAMEQSYPNPASLATGNSTVLLHMAAEGSVRLELYDALGRRVRTLIDSRLDAGRHFVDVPLRGLEQGIYFYRLSTGGEHITRRMVLTP